MSPLSREAIFTVLSGLTVLACEKTPQVAAEPAPSAQAAAPGAPSAAVGAKEVPSAQGAGAEAEKTCSPGGCAPGQCGGNKKK
jgi:hypothetical protein